MLFFGNDNNEYVQAVNNKALYNWEEDNLLKDYGPYIKKHLSAALKKNKNLTKQITKERVMHYMDSEAMRQQPMTITSPLSIHGISAGIFINSLVIRR